MNQVHLSDALRDFILAMARREDVHSVSCQFQDAPLWEGLLHEQVKRSRQTGQRPRDAFFLCGPDSGMPGIAKLHPGLEGLPEEEWFTGDTLEERLGGSIHIPYEGRVWGRPLRVSRVAQGLSPSVAEGRRRTRLGDRTEALQSPADRAGSRTACVRNAHRSHCGQLVALQQHRPVQGLQPVSPIGTNVGDHGERLRYAIDHRVIGRHWPSSERSGQVARQPNRHDQTTPKSASRVKPDPAHRRDPR
jgi:hypothetical protein